MKKLLLLAALCVAGAAQAQVFPSGPFGTVAPWIENYDAMAPGSYTSFPVWGGNASFSRLTPVNGIVVGAPLTPLSAPNAVFGRGVDVQIRVNQPMRLFGGFFKLAPFGIAVTQARFRFYDAFNNFIGQGVAPINPGWTWIGWQTIPAWHRVEVIGNGSLAGYVAFDETRCRP